MLKALWYPPWRAPPPEGRAPTPPIRTWWASSALRRRAPNWTTVVSGMRNNFKPLFLMLSKVFICTCPCTCPGWECARAWWSRSPHGSSFRPELMRRIFRLPRMQMCILHARQVPRPTMEMGWAPRLGEPDYSSQWLCLPVSVMEFLASIASSTLSKVRKAKPRDCRKVRND